MALGDTLIEVSGVAKHFGEGETRVGWCSTASRCSTADGCAAT
jgi:aspartate/methionine/tyrosine aminotransferase